MADLVVGALASWTSVSRPRTRGRHGSRWSEGIGSVSTANRSPGSSAGTLVSFSESSSLASFAGSAPARSGSCSADHARAASLAGDPRRQAVVVAEADLRPHVLDDPHSRLIDGRLGSRTAVRARGDGRRYELEHLTNDLVSLGESRVDLKPHQVSVVHRVITDYPHRFLLCDEVGLGKTIEAGDDPQGAARPRGGADRVLVDRPAEPDAPVAVRAEDEVQRDLLDHQQRDGPVPASHAGADGNPFEDIDSVIVSSVVDHRRRSGRGWPPRSTGTW